MNLKEAKKQLKKRVDFKKLSKKKQRVLLAKDVIAELKLRKLTAESGTTYVAMTIDPSKIFSKKQLKVATKKKVSFVDEALGDSQIFTEEVQVSETPRRSCYVCALGAMFMADVDRRNKLKARVSTNEIESYDFRKSKQTETLVLGFQRSDLRARLNRLFSDEQLNLIETAFEGFIVGGYTPASSDAVDFWNYYGDDKERMIAIMQNIVENDGTFIPPDAEALASLDENSDDDEGGAASSSASEDGVCADEGDYEDAVDICDP